MDTQLAEEFKASRTPYVRIEQLTTRQQVNALTYVAGAVHAYLKRNSGSAPATEAMSEVASQLHITTDEVQSGVQYGEQEGTFVYSPDGRRLSIGDSD